MHVTTASPRSVETRDTRGEKRVYHRTAIGWRRRTEQLHDEGDLVTDPSLSALLDAAAESG